MTYEYSLIDIESFWLQESFVPEILQNVWKSFKNKWNISIFELISDHKHFHHLFMVLCWMDYNTIFYSLIFISILKG